MSDERLLLVVVGEDRAGAELPRQGVLTIGSSKERAGFCVEGPGIEGLHCAIGRTKGGGFALKDLGSSSGTRLNGKRVETARVKAGDRIHVGGKELRVLAPAGAGSSAGAGSPAGAIDRAHETGAVDPSTPVTPVPGAPAGVAALDPQPDAPTLSGYRIERALGRGGMGSVYLAVQTSLDRPVALKVLAPKLAADAEFVRRFQAEARAAAALAHPNVVTVYDVGTEKGVHYLSMEYMDRGTLEERVARAGRLEWGEALAVLRDAAAGLVYAEAKGIVHRDLKPANLMQNHVGATKIADLGLATHVEAEERQAAEKKVFGTPHFMSPEQVRGEKLDGRSDLYSLGATAYRLLTGHTPFEGANAREIVRAHLALEPRPMRDFVPDLPEEALALVGRLMKKPAPERFGSASELLKEIERLRAQGGRPAAPRPKRVPIVLGAVAVLAAAALWISSHRSQNAPVSSPRPPPTAGDPVLAAEPEAVGAPEPAPAESPAKPKDDDKELQLLEAKAKVALFELLGKEMTPAEKSAALRELAGAWRGTTAATEAVEKAQAIDTDLATRASADVDHQARIDELVARLSSAAAPAPGEESAPPTPAKTLGLVRAVPGQEAAAGDPAFALRRQEIERGVLARAADFARPRLAEVDDAMRRGAFDGLEEKLQALLPVLELPDPLPGGPADGESALRELSTSVHDRLANLARSRTAFFDKQTRDDALAIAHAFGGSTGFEREIRTLDLAGARARVAAAQEVLGSPSARAFATALDADLAAAQTSLRTLGREFSSWRRRSFTDPRPGKGGTRNAVGADEDGILAEDEHVPWSVFGGDDREISKLFTERLAREWTPDELRGIAALLRMTAVVEALGRAGKMFDGTRRSNFTDADQKEMTECFAQAEIWADKAGSSAAVKKEAAAAHELAVVCEKMTEGAWSVAVSAAEDLLLRHADTLLVKLISDGTLPVPPVEPATAAPPANASAPASAPTKPSPKSGN
jgi:serine/threonine protein kinase